MIYLLCIRVCIRRAADTLFCLQRTRALPWTIAQGGTTAFCLIVSILQKKKVRAPSPMLPFSRFLLNTVFSRPAHQQSLSPEGLPLQVISASKTQKAVKTESAPSRRGVSGTETLSGQTRPLRTYKTSGSCAQLRPTSRSCPSCSPRHSPVFAPCCPATALSSLFSFSLVKAPN